MIEILGLSPDHVRHVDKTCDRFEVEWKSGRRPSIRDYIDGAAEPVRSALLHQLLLVDWDYRCRSGDNPRTGDYVTLFPSDSTVVEGVVREMAGSVYGGQRSEDGGQESEGRYELLQEVGHGGIGIVRRGRDRSLGREVAIKVLRGEYCDREDARRRFINEARVGSRLQHPAIVPVYEQGQFEDGRPYFTMKLVQGHTLAELLRDRAETTQDLTRFLGIFEHVCQAIAYAHAQAVVHRDLKPANIMVGAFGEVQVMDWGFAKQLQIADCRLQIENQNDAADADLEVCNLHSALCNSESGMLMGTPAYMPFEQASGQVSQIDRRTDVFSLGAILCEIVTGRPPYIGNSGEEVHRQAVAGDVAEACARIDHCGADEALRSLAKRCLAKDRDQRPADAGVVVQEITTYLASAQERIRQLEVERAAATARAKSERRMRVMILSLAGTFLLGAGIATWQAVAATRARELANKSEKETRSVLGFLRTKVFNRTFERNNPLGGLGPDVTLREVLETALPALDTDFQDQPRVEAQLRLTIGKTIWSLKDFKIAAVQFQKARQLYAALGDRGEELRAACALAEMLEELGNHADAVPILQDVVTGRTTLLGADHPDTNWTRWHLVSSLMAVNRSNDAIALIDEFARDAPSQPRARSHSILALLNLRLRHFEKLGDVVGCRQTAVLWENLQRTDGDSLLQAARYRAVTAKVVAASDRSQGGAHEAADQAERAMAWLQKAVAAGFKDAAKIKEDNDLAALRSRADFQKLLTSR